MSERPDTATPEIDAFETADWLESLDAVIEHSGPDRARFLLTTLINRAHRAGAVMPFPANTPYINTIPVAEQPPYPGDLGIERQIAAIIRWNAMAMVVRANRNSAGIGGHISSFASAATLYEVAFNHHFRASTPDQPGDSVYFQGHAAPGIYARAFLEGRITVDQLHNFRRELAHGGGLPSYPHPYAMPEFWQYPTVSMGLSAISAIYQARFNRYLQNRGLLSTESSRVWCFLGDGEMDEPESLGAITLASRENLDNLIFVINCNLQRLDGPVRGNGKIVQELEAAFRGAGWHAIKVLWGSGWDPLLEADTSGILQRRMMEAVDGEYQRYKASDGAYVREHFFGKYQDLRYLVAHLTDDEIWRLRRGGHDATKINAAYTKALEQTGSPTVILAKTIKGYGLGEAGEGRNITHQQKKLNEEELRHFRDRFDIPIKDSDLAEAPFYRPDDNSELMQYLHERRQALGGYLPKRSTSAPALSIPSDIFESFTTGSGEREVATTMVFVRMLSQLMSHPTLGQRVVPIVPDEARTFGMDALFRKHGIYAHKGQLYEPVDSNFLLYYREASDGQLLEEGITEAGSMASFAAAGTAYSTHGIQMIPVFLFYSMFGFQRIGDSIWQAADMRARGFLVGCTAGRTTLAGEGLQHQDGHSLLHASTVPNVVSYDLAYAHEIAIVFQRGLERMYADNEDVIYYLTMENEPYLQPVMPEDCTEGVLRGMYLIAPAAKESTGPRLQLFGSGAIVRETLAAGQLLASQFDVAADVWSVTSYTELKRDAMATEHWNLHHPAEPPRTPFLVEQLAGHDGPVVCATDYVRALPDQIAPWLGRRMTTLGTDGFGRSDCRESLRRHFEVDAASIAYAAAYALARDGKLTTTELASAAATWGMDPDKRPSWIA